MTFINQIWPGCSWRPPGPVSCDVNPEPLIVIWWVSVCMWRTYSSERV